MGGGLGILPNSQAENIIADFSVNLIIPTTSVGYSNGPASQTLTASPTKILKKLEQIIRDTDPTAESTVKSGKIAAFIVAIVFAVICLSVAISTGIFVIMAAAMFVAFGCSAGYSIWSRNYGKRWREKVVPKILNYCKNELKETNPNIGIHVIYPINRYSNRSVSAIWMVIRLTNGSLQQPCGGPINWSSDGTVTQPFGFVNIQQPQQVVQQQQQQINMQQQLQQMVQQQQQQIQQLQQLVQNQQNQQQIVSSEPQNENQEGIGMNVQQTQEIKQISNDSNVNSTQETPN